ncbi:MAG: hypothetical protein KDA42_05940 [Planctomycetales bacterium]|nr:hypothetical protein [Planctomycetales bacterium]
MEDLYDKNGDDVYFLLVYIREAHPVGDRLAQVNRLAGIEIEQPTTHAERRHIAESMCQKLDISLPTVIDNLDDAVNQAYNAFPDRIYLVSQGGTIAYQGGPGPFGFSPDELREAIEKELAGKMP